MRRGWVEWNGPLGLGGCSRKGLGKWSAGVRSVVGVVGVGWGVG